MEQNVNNKKNHTAVWIGMIAVGIVLIIVGGICAEKFYSENSEKKETYSKTFESVNINNINVDGGLINLRIEKSQDNSDQYIGVNGTDLIKNRLKCDVKNGTLTIAYKRKWFDFFQFQFLDWDNDTADANITITVPNKQFKKIDIDGGVGTTEIDGIDVIEFDFDGGVGENNFSNLNVLGNANIDLGVGKTAISESALNQSEINVGVGRFDFSGKLNGDTDIDSGVGSVTMDIDGYKLDYNINYDKGVGDVEINGADRETATIKHDIDIDCGVGEVKLNFNGSDF